MKRKARSGNTEKPRDTEENEHSSNTVKPQRRRKERGEENAGDSATPEVNPAGAGTAGTGEKDSLGRAAEGSREGAVPPRAENRSNREGGKKKSASRAGSPGNEERFRLPFGTSLDREPEHEALLDYLHGTLSDEEAPAALAYEQARHLPAASDEGRGAKWQIEDFPCRAWRELSEEERASVRLDLAPPLVRPLRILDARDVRGKYLAGLIQQRAEEAREAGVPVGEAPTSIRHGLLEYMMIAVNHGEPVEQTVKRFRLLLDERRKAAGISERPTAKKRGAGSSAKDRLRDVAAARLVAHFEVKGAIDWTAKHRRSLGGKCCRWHGQREEPAVPTGRNVLASGYALYKDARDWLEAVERAELELSRIHF